MLRYDSVKDLIDDLCQDLSQFGEPIVSRSTSGKEEVKSGYERLGQSFLLIDWKDRDESLIEAGYNLEFAEQDFNDRLSPVPLNPGKAIELDTSGVLKSTLDENGVLEYTYSERMYYQLERIIQMLKLHPDTRQAYLSIWNPVMDMPLIGTGRVPCSLGYQFYIRGGEVQMIYLMRSLNVAGYIGNDIYTATRLIEYVADRLGLQPGTLEIFACNLHYLK